MCIFEWRIERHQWLNGEKKAENPYSSGDLHILNVGYAWMQTHHKQRCTGRLLLMSLEASSNSSNSNWQKHNSQFLILSCITQQELELRISFPSFSCRWSSDLWHGLAHILPASKSGELLKNLAGHLKICKAIPDLVQFERGSTEFLLTATSPANFLKVGWDHWPPFY